MAKESTLISASEQAAVTDALKRHWATLAFVGGGLVLATWLAGRQQVSLTGFAYLVFGLLLWLAWSVLKLAWWMNRRRRLLARASLPAPSLAGMARDWWLERRRIRYILKQWPAFCEVNNYRGIGKIIPKLRKFQSTVEGDVSCMVSPGPISVKGGVDKLVSLAYDLREVVGCQEVLVRRVGVAHAVLTFLWTEAMERVLPIAEMPASAPEQVAYGMRRDGSAASIKITDHDLLGGMTGAGKSGDAWARFADLNRKGVTYEPYVSNLKGGAEFKAFEDKLGLVQGPLRVAAYASNVPDTIKMIAAFEKAMKKRAEEFPHRQWKVEHADEWPLSILVLDESVELMMKMDTKQRAVLDTCLSQGRAQGFVVWMLSQQGQVEILKHTRNYLPSRRSLAQRDSVSTNMFLGDGAEQAGALCSKIVNRPGVGYSYDESRRGYELFRSAWVDDDDMERIAQGLVPEGMDGSQKLPSNRQCAVYYFFTADMQSVYIGISVDPVRRRDEHAGVSGSPAKWWWEHVDESRTVIRWADSEDAARAMEERDIKRYLPLGNKQHNADNPLAGRAPVVLPPASQPRRHWWQSVPQQPSRPAAPVQPENVTPIRRRTAAAPQQQTPTRTRRRA